MDTDDWIFTTLIFFPAKIFILFFFQSESAMHDIYPLPLEPLSHLPIPPS